jgi:hypothetical protein
MEAMVGDVLLICLSIFIALSCKKTKYTAPDVSPNGEYFNCKIDGKYWTFKTCSYCNDPLTAGREVVDRPHFSIMAGNSDYPQTQFDFFIDTAEINHHDTISFSQKIRAMSKFIVLILYRLVISSPLKPLMEARVG